MKLDPRIFPSKQPLTCFDVELAKDFIGKECYFSNSAKKYEDLKEIEDSTGIYYRKGVLTKVYTDNQEAVFLDNINAEFRFCLPAEWVLWDPRTNFDKRIIKRDFLDRFDKEEAKQYIGKKCFYTDELENFSDLDSPRVHIGTLSNFTEEFIDKGFGPYVATSHGSMFYAKYIIPCEWVKQEPTYIPYTVIEFIKEYPLGSHLCFGPKSKTMEMHRLVDGYNDCKNGAGTLFLSGRWYSMTELFNDYEIYRDGHWGPSERN